MSIMIGVVTFLVLAVLLGVVLKVSIIMSVILGIFGAGITFLLLKYSKKSKTRMILFCSWGILFFVLVITSNIMHPDFFICPSKIPLIGDNAGDIPNIPNSDQDKSILPCPFGIFQNYASSFQMSGFLPSIIYFSIKFFGVIFFVWLILALILGRSWCGWICPFGGMIESISRVGKKPIWKIDVNTNASRSLRYGFFFGVILLIFAVKAAPSYTYCLICPFKGVYHSPGYFTKILSVSTEFITYSLFIGLFVVATYLIKKRVWCAVLCPLGTLTSIVGSYSLITTRIDENTCVNCKKCVNTCKLGATFVQDGTVSLNSMACSNCGECMNECPKDSINYYIRGTNIEVKNIFFPFIVVSAITIAVMLVTVMWKPVLDAISKMF